MSVEDQHREHTYKDPDYDTPVRSDDGELIDYRGQAFVLKDNSQVIKDKKIAIRELLPVTAGTPRYLTQWGHEIDFVGTVVLPKDDGEMVAVFEPTKAGGMVATIVRGTQYPGYKAEVESPVLYERSEAMGIDVDDPYRAVSVALDEWDDGLTELATVDPDSRVADILRCLHEARQRHEAFLRQHGVPQSRLRKFGSWLRNPIG